MMLLLAFLATQVSSSTTLELNDGWKFATLSNPPSIWTGADAIPTSSWKVIKVSSEETEGESAAASKAFDGNSNTFWHTKWQGIRGEYPHEIVIDLGSKVEAVGFRLLPRQTGPKNGHPNHLQVFLSENSDSWGVPVVAAEVPNTSNLFQKAFSASRGRFLRLLVNDGYEKDPFLVLAEIGLIRSLDQKQKQDWESQYHIANVNAGDERFDLKGQALEEIKKAELAKIKPADWKGATLPHTPWVRPLGKSEIWQGVTYYRRTLDLSSEQVNKSLELSIGAAMQVSDLWLNGVHLATRRGGYLPLVANLTGKVKTRNEVLVRVDNNDNPLVPPGKPQQDLDFMYGAGIHREAKLVVHEQVHLTVGGTYIRTKSIEGSNATIEATYIIRNDSNESQHVKMVQQTLPSLDIGRAIIDVPPRQSKTVSIETKVHSAATWSPHRPFQYVLQTTFEENGKPDRVQFKRFGIRTIEVSRSKGFVLNHKPLELIGTNRHQDYPWVGPALSRQANYRDAKMIKDSGHNIVRLAHYPQSEDFLDACDDLGLMVIPCIPGWQFLNNDSRFKHRVLDDIRELIERDGSHPSVAWFEASLNETYPDNETANSWYKAGKSTVFGDNVLLAGDAKPGAPWDIPYNQWNDEDMSRPQNVVPDKPGYVREYGDYEFGGGYSSSRVKMGQGIKKLLGETWNHIWSLNHLKPQLPWTMGFGTWEMFDHNVPWEFSVSASGLADLFRREKPSYWFYKSQTTTDPYLKVATEWQLGPKTRRVVVFTNCGEAVLSINGKEIARAKPMRGAGTKYGDASAFDGSNTEHLKHPPIVFSDVPFTAGTLKVEGKYFGKTVSDVVKTAGKPVGIKVWLDTLGYAVGTNDLVFARAAVVDADGRVCPTDSRMIHFSVAGVELAGESDVACELGVASALIRTPMTKSRVKVTASALGLRSGTN